MKTQTMLKKQWQKGVSLVEVMVALFVLAVGILGILSMQLNSIKANKMASVYSEASYLANSLVESMRTTPDMINSYQLALTDTAPAASNDCVTAGIPCTSAEIAAVNLRDFVDSVTATLPSGKAGVTVNTTTRQIDIQIEFDSVYDEQQRDLNTSGAVVNKKESFILKTVI